MASAAEPEHADRARRLAFDALRAVHADGGYANLVLSRLLAERRLPARDAAFATELVAGTCRRQGSYDTIIEAAGQRRLGSLQPAVVDLLRLGTHQLLGMRVSPHGAVSATVDLAGATVGRRVRGLVNAILRRVAAHDYADWVDLLSRGMAPLEALALRTAHPRWIVDAYAEVLPADELAAALAANNQPAEVTLAVRPGLATVAELLAAGATAGAHSPFAARYSGNPADLAAVREGRAGVQDEGSQLVTLALTRASAPTGPWLDLCAGPGGKSALLAGLAGPGDGLLAAELSPHRAALVAAALRGYPAPPGVVVADGRAGPWRPGTFTRVMADVPCTGLGALRRRPESRWRRTADSVTQLHDLQVGLLNAAIEATAPGGVIGYVTCSPVRAETTQVVAQVLAGRADVDLIPAAELLPELSHATVGEQLQLWPHRHGTDAMFAAFLRRR